MYVSLQAAALKLQEIPFHYLLLHRYERWHIPHTAYPPTSQPFPLDTSKVWDRMGSKLWGIPHSNYPTVRPRSTHFTGVAYSHCNLSGRFEDNSVGMPPG